MFKNYKLHTKTAAIMTGFIALATSAISEEQTVKSSGIEQALNRYFFAIPLIHNTKTDLRYIPTKINDIESVMLIDSGANATVFNTEFAKKNKIKLSKYGKVKGAAGDADSYKGEVSSISLGGIIKFSQPLNIFVDFKKGPEVSLNGKKYQFAGNLGYNLLSALDLNFDTKHNQFLMVKPKINIKGGLWSLLEQINYQKVDLKKTDRACYVPVKIGDKEGYFILDTGSNQTILFEKFATGKNYKVVSQAKNVEAIGKKKMALKKMLVDDFKFANLTIKVPMPIAPRKIVNIEGKPVMGVLGVGVLGQLGAVVNIKAGGIYLPKSK